MKKKAKKATKTKLYAATRMHTTLLLCDNKSLLKDIAAESLNEEYDLIRPNFKFPMVIKEIKSVKDIPKDWASSALLWGTEADLTAKQWLNGECSEEENDPQYQEYLRLKEIYG